MKAKEKILTDYTSELIILPTAVVEVYDGMYYRSSASPTG